MSKIGIKPSLTTAFTSAAGLKDGALIDAVVALSNAQGGTVYLGVEESGAISGLPADLMDEARLKAIISQRTVPPVLVRTRLLTLVKPVLAVSVPRSDCVIAAADGTVLKRRLTADGRPVNAPLFPREMSFKPACLKRLDFSAQAVPDAAYSDLDPQERQRLRQVICAQSGDASLLELDDRAFDLALGLIKEDDGTLRPTCCGLLLIGRTEALARCLPGAAILLEAKDAAGRCVKERFTLPLAAALAAIQDRLNTLRSGAEPAPGIESLSQPDYDPRALQEAVVNALCHRDYVSLEPVQLKLSAAGLTITNPGGFTDGSHAEAAALLTIEPYCRNQALAEALRRLGLTSGAGLGLPRLIAGALRTGRALPHFSQSTKGKTVLFLPAGPADKAFSAMIAGIEQRLRHHLSAEALLILHTLWKLRIASALELTPYVKLSAPRLESALDALESAGVIESGCLEGKRYCFLSKDCFKAAFKAAAPCRVRAPDAKRLGDLAVQFARKHGFITRRAAASLLHLTAPQAYRLLKKLVSAGRLTAQGQGAGARYTAPELTA